LNAELLKWIPWIPAAAALLCGLCCLHKSMRAPAAVICILGLGAALAISLGVTLTHPGAFNFTPGQPASTMEARHVLTVAPWFDAGASGAPGGQLLASWGYFIDPLTLLMLLVVTGIGTLVAIYAAGYMQGDRGYARFFAFVSLFIFAMTSLVMADNLILLYLGWEGVGLCSYLLIGFYYERPSAVAAAKKAFIVNRIGDVGFALGIFLTYEAFGTVRYAELFPKLAAAPEGNWVVQVIPFLLMLGAFGKSAQLPLYVWLPDAMEGPTPVSALIHAATMVTAGVYMIARLLPLFALSPYALPTVAVVGGLTALFAATIALCQFDLKRIYAYSTISQLGYMFLGLGALSSFGGLFHLFTHAFFKALLFLSAGSVMHALAGQIDLRKISGLGRKMPITAGLMFVGCLALAGFPGTAGFFSKDAILAAVLERGMAEHQPLFVALAGLGLFTAFLTAFYTFRLWFRVFVGPTHYEMGSQGHGDEHGHAAEAHEVGWLMNGPLVVLALGALGAGAVCTWLGWPEHAVAMSTATAPVGESVSIAGLPLHAVMMWLSSLLAIAGIGLAAYYHWYNRPAADQVAARFQGLVTLLQNKYYVDEIYDGAIVRPLRLLGEICYVFDRMVIDGLVTAVGWLPRLLGFAAAPAQSGRLQGYGLGTVLGAVVVVAVVLLAVMR
jgi:NADH-quinone oxidoreductase subunit L